MEEKSASVLKSSVESYWRDYKAVRLQGIYYGTFFQSNLSLSDWVNSQRLLCPLFVWAMVMMEYGICLKKLAALLLDRKF